MLCRLIFSPDIQKGFFQMEKSIYKNINRISKCPNALEACVLQNNRSTIWSQKVAKFIDPYPDLYLFSLNSNSYDIRQS